MESKAFILSNLWENREGTKWEPQCTFERKKAAPLDKFSLFNGLSSVQEYVANDGTAYPGQMVTVIDSNLSTTSVYTIQVDGSLKQVDTALPDIGNGLSVSTNGAIEVAATDGLSVTTEGQVAVATGEHMTVDENGRLTLSDLCLDGGDCEGNVA